MRSLDPMTTLTEADVEQAALGWGNPTIVVLTDRNDLDDQLFGILSRCQDLLRQPPGAGVELADLRRKLSANPGGEVFPSGRASSRSPIRWQFLFLAGGLKPQSDSRIPWT